MPRTPEQYEEICSEKKKVIIQRLSEKIFFNNNQV